MNYTFDGFYTEELLRAHPDKMFVFGDNLLRVGYGGQAVIRDEPNAVGVPTKKSPSQFFDEDSAHVIPCYLERLPADNLVIPVLPNGQPSLGCGLAELPERAPRAYQGICDWFSTLETVPLP